MRDRPIFKLISLATIVCACHSSSDDAHAPAHPLAPEEVTLRHALGIPDDAQQVIVFGQNAHLDIDWQKTFDDYYTTFVGNVFLEARAIVDAQPRAFYSIAEMAFLEHHLEAHPEEEAPIRAAIARGQIHVVGGGITSPDTFLPETEMLARDFLYGVRFAEDRLGAHPTSAWLPDSFGHSATAPDVLAAAGFDSVAFSRIDGAQTIFQQIFRPDDEPPPDSTRAALAQLGSADFLWQGAGGATLLAHFLSGTGLYCQGDNIDYAEGIQIAGGHTGDFKGDDPSFTDDAIDAYVTQLSPLAKTPYLFVPVGCDFAHPKDRLIEYLDGYDKRRYPDTHVWAVAAPFDDYTALVSHWRDVLPTISGELSPYFMGFYGSRPDVKRGVRDAARPFFVAETFAVALGADGTTIMQAASPTLEILARTDHHDFVTGTSADPVVASEQRPFLANARDAGNKAVSAIAAALAKRIPMASGATQRVVMLNASSVTRSDVAEVIVPITAGVAPSLHAVSGSGSSAVSIPLELVTTPAPTDTTATLRLAATDVPPFSWRAIDLLPGADAAPTPRVTLALLDAAGAPTTVDAATRVVLSNDHVRATIDRSGATFTLSDVTLDGVATISGATLVDYADDGGLWRLGHEMPGCAFTQQGTSKPETETLKVLEQTALGVRLAIVSASTTRELFLGAGATGLDLAVTTSAAQQTTRTIVFALTVDPSAKLRTSSPAGFVERAPEHVFSPTFYPAVDWIEVGGVAILLRQSTGVRMSTPGAVELMVARDARVEKCEALGGSGSDPDVHRIEWRIERVTSVADAAREAQAFDRPLDLEIVPLDQAASPDLPVARSLVSIDGDALLTALKPADRGSGVIARVVEMPGPATIHLDPSLGLTKATWVDLVERDLRPLGPVTDALVVDGKSAGAIATLRLE
jgi:hypothetical protein